MYRYQDMSPYAYVPCMPPKKGAGRVRMSFVHYARVHQPVRPSLNRGLFDRFDYCDMVGDMDFDGDLARNGG